MAVLFVSHSSKDDQAANALERWLHANGFTDVFVDHQSLAGGDKWRDELRASAAACRVVICLVSENWLTSDECYGEFAAATYTMGKRIIPLFLLRSGSDLGEAPKKRLANVCAEDQGINLEPCLGTDGALDLEADRSVAARLVAGLRAAGALARVGLDPGVFPIDPRSPPFPGLASFGDDDADAALFYGRSREIAHVLEELRKMRAEHDTRPLVILGASGAGKSSLLKAGIIPRLRREAPAWLPLRSFRPGANPLLNFADAFARTYANFNKVEAAVAIRDRLLEAWSRAERDEHQDLTVAGVTTLASTLEAEGHKLRAAAGRAGASILVSVDQAEEVARAEDKGADVLADYLHAAAVATQTGWQLAFTIRSDSFPELQSHRRFRGLEARGYDLRPLPVFRFDSVIEEPARRYGVKVEDELVDVLMQDAPQEDALPLLAFAMQRLWPYAASGTLTKDNYRKVGGLKGLIEDAAERALRGIAPNQDVPVPSGAPPQRLVEMAARAFVPALAQINEQGATIRRVVDWARFDHEEQALLTNFAEWRLVVRKGEGDTEGGTVEVAHEALFREWSRLQSWLEPERARLEALRSLQTAALAWDRHGRKAGFLDHRRGRLSEARSLARNERYRARLGDVELGYLAACRSAERIREFRTDAGALAILLAAGLTYIGLADSGVAVFGAGSLQRLIDRYGISFFRPVHSYAEIERAAAPARNFISDRIHREWTEKRWHITHDTRTIGPKASLRVWISSQAMSAVFHSLDPQSTNLQDHLDALMAPFAANDLVEVGGKKFGWLRDDFDYPLAQPATWTLAALAIAWGSAPLGNDLRERLLTKLDYTQTVAEMYRPLDDGGWNALPQQDHEEEHSTYVTTLAFLAMLEVRQAGLGWHGDRLQLDAMLRASAAWLAEQFDDQNALPGWRVHVNDAGSASTGVVSDGLTLQIYSELLRAEEEANIPIPAQILAAIPRHLDLLLGRANDYPTSTGTIWRNFTNIDGSHLTRTINEEYLWHPWAIECAVRWLRRLQRVDGTPEAKVQARRVLGYLVVDLGTKKLGATALERNVLYEDSEELYALGTLLSYLSANKEGSD
jgi:hypothetical protein